MLWKKGIVSYSLLRSVRFYTHGHSKYMPLYQPCDNHNPNLLRLLSLYVLTGYCHLHHNVCPFNCFQKTQAVKYNLDHDYLTLHQSALSKFRLTNKGHRQKRLHGLLQYNTYSTFRMFSSLFNAS